MNFFAFPLNELPFVVLVMLVAFSVHEFAHAWTAWKFGDDTAYMAGRVTLNPMAHLDWIGMLFLVVGGFGWARPVPVRPSRFRSPRLMSVLVSAAGPFSNFLLFVIGLLAIYILNAVHFGAHASSALLDTVQMFLNKWLQINMILLLFNLIPLPPLDGYRILEQFMPIRIRIRMHQNEQWGMFIFLLLVFLPPLRHATIDQVFSLARPIHGGLTQLFDRLFQVSRGGGTV
jgi:Zn-dependent protease